MKVIDGGPACYVENDAGGPVIDASFSMCQSCTNSIRSDIIFTFWYNRLNI